MENAIVTKEKLKDKYVAFLDVLGFSDLVYKGRVESLNLYFSRIKEVLDELKFEKANLKALLISDSIILVAPNNIKGFKDLVSAIRRIQFTLVYRKILLRGAVSHGQVLFDDVSNIIVGRGFIQAYLLEREAKYPRVIIDPMIVKIIAKSDRAKFHSIINGTLNFELDKRLIYRSSQYSKIEDDCIFIDYVNKTIKKDVTFKTIGIIRDVIVENLYNDQKLFMKYIWLRDYMVEIIKLSYDELYIQSTSKSEDTELKRRLSRLEYWKQEFESL